MTRSLTALLFAVLLLLGAVRNTQAAQFLIDTIGDSITSGYPYYWPIEGNGCTARPTAGTSETAEFLARPRRQGDVVVLAQLRRRRPFPRMAWRVSMRFSMPRCPSSCSSWRAPMTCSLLSPATVYDNIAYMVVAASPERSAYSRRLPPDIRNGEEYINKPIVETNACCDNWPELKGSGYWPGGPLQRPGRQLGQPELRGPAPQPGRVRGHGPHLVHPGARQDQRHDQPALADAPARLAERDRAQPAEQGVGEQVDGQADRQGEGEAEVNGKEHAEYPADHRE